MIIIRTSYTGLFSDDDYTGQFSDDNYTLTSFPMTVIRASSPMFNNYNVGETPETETVWSAYGLFQAHRYHLELN